MLSSTVALGELLAVRTQDETEVYKVWLLRTKRPVEERLAGSVREMLFAPDDVADPHLQVVHDGREVVGGCAVGLDENEVAYFSERNLPPQSIPEAALPERVGGRKYSARRPSSSAAS